jgi:hypothetical protein
MAGEGSRRNGKGVAYESRWTGRVGRFGQQERKSAVWALAVVMGGVGAEHVLEVAAAEEQ